MTTIGLIKEGKVPPDSRVALTPKQCSYIQQHYPIRIVVEPSPSRCYSDAEYEAEGIPLSTDMAQCDILMGVKEVPVAQLIPEKTYLFFSHTIKEQHYNREMLRAILEKNIRLVDYEVLTDEQGRRLIAFGVFAGMVGAHNALYTYSRRTGTFELPRLKDCKDYEAAKAIYKTIQWPAVKIVLTGGGRVASGAARVLDDMGIKRLSPEEYLADDFDEAVYTQIDCDRYVARKAGGLFSFRHFFENPGQYQSTFLAYAAGTDIMINGIFWDKRAPAFFTAEEMKHEGFRISVIADVTCDIAPESSIPSTLRPTTIADPIFGFNPMTGQETEPHQPHVIDMMTIDNLPNELPRDASKAFGQQFIGSVLDPLLADDHPVIHRATIAEGGKLSEQFRYLENYVAVSS